MAATRKEKGKQNSLTHFGGGQTRCLDTSTPLPDLVQRRPQCTKKKKKLIPHTLPFRFCPVTP